MSESHHPLEPLPVETTKIEVAKIESLDEDKSVVEARQALLLAIMYEQPNHVLTDEQRQELDRDIASAMDEWLLMEDSFKAKVWAAARKRTEAANGPHPVLEQLRIMAGRTSTPSDEATSEKIPYETFELASDTFQLILFQRETGHSPS